MFFHNLIGFCFPSILLSTLFELTNHNIFSVFIFSGSRFMVNLHARMLLWLSVSLKRVVRMYFDFGFCVNSSKFIQYYLSNNKCHISHSTKETSWQLLFLLVELDPARNIWMITSPDTNYQDHNKLSLIDCFIVRVCF